MQYTRVYTALFAISLLAANAFSQVNSASLTGLVTGPTDALITGAKVVARSTATGAVRAVETNSTGYFS